MVEWPRGEAAACKAAYTGSNPVSTSLTTECSNEGPRGRLAQGLARFLDTEEVTGSIPVSPTTHTLGAPGANASPKYRAEVPFKDRLQPIVSDGSGAPPYCRDGRYVRAHDVGLLW